MTNEIATSSFENNLAVQMKHAEILSQANMIPDKFKGNPANVLVAQELAQSMGESTWVTMSELYFVGNVPTFSAKYMRTRVRAAKHILRESFDPETMTATCTIIRHDDPDFEHTIRWDKAKAEAHGLWGKGHWKKNPELMLKNRLYLVLFGKIVLALYKELGKTFQERLPFYKKKYLFPKILQLLYQEAF